MKLLKRKYNDEVLVLQAERALRGDPTVNAATLDVSSKDGIVIVSGRVNSSLAQRHALETVRGAYHHAGLKYETIVDRIAVI
jgi:osmotically-inducible protein OsmY